MGKRRRLADIQHEAAECDMWLSTNRKQPVRYFEAFN